MRIAFVWQGISGRYGMWKDGLYAAMKIIEKTHTVTYHEPTEDITDVDVILYWEAPCTCLGKDRDNYNKVRKNPLPKALLFAGGEIRKDWVKEFDLLFTESKLNDDDCERLGIPYVRAFGINDSIMKPIEVDKVYDGIIQATFAAWKRHHLFAEALGDKGLACGRKQDHEPQCHEICTKYGVKVLDDQLPETVAYLINQSHTVVNTSEFWGGGQRCTLEAMACGVPVIVMNDSPKNREYVEESQAGLVVDPSPDAIRKAIEEIKNWTPEEKARGIEYVKGKWTAQHYADSILAGINKII